MEERGRVVSAESKRKEKGEEGIALQRKTITVVILSK